MSRKPRIKQPVELADGLFLSSIEWFRRIKSLSLRLISNTENRALINRRWERQIPFKNPVLSDDFQTESSVIVKGAGA